MLKRWFNKQFGNENLLNGNGPFFYELCGHSWCPRFAVYDHRCPRHQEDQ